MLNKNTRKMGCGIAVLLMGAALLSGCSSANFGGGGVFGGTPVQVAQVSGIDTYSADGALVEARSHFRENNFGYSAAFYKRAVEMAPQDAAGYVGLGASYDQLGQFEMSDRVYASLHRISGDSVQYFNNVGYSHLLRGELTVALTNFRKAAALDPDNMIVANNVQMLADAAALSSA